MNIKIVLNLNFKDTKFPLKYFYNLGGFPLLSLFIKRIKNNNDKFYIFFSDKKIHKEISEILNAQELRSVLNKKIKTKKNILKKINFSSNDVVIFLSLQNPIIDRSFLNKVCMALSFENRNYIQINRNFELFFGKKVLKKALKNKSKKIKNLKLLQRIFSNLKFSINSIEEFIYLNKVLKKAKKPLELKTDNIINEFKKIRNINNRLKVNLKKRLIILGGSHDQIGTIKTANSMNINTIVFDKNFYSPGKKIAELFIFKSAKDSKSISNFAKKIGANGVLLQGPDFPQVSSAIEQTMGIKNIPLTAAKICTNKYMMKKFFKKHSIPVPKFKLLNKSNKKKINLKFPVVVKPLDKSASRGVFICKNQKELNRFKNKTFSETQKQNILVEQFLTGPQISTETFIKNWKIYTPGFVDRNYEMIKYTSPNIIENGGNYPSKNLQYYYQINKFIKIISRSLKIKNGTIKGDIVIHNNNIYFIEVAVRLSGGDFSETIIPLSSSFDLIKNSINLAIQNKIKKKDLLINYKKIHIAHRYFFSKKGQLVNIYGLNEIRKKPWVKKIKIFKNKGDFLPKTTNHSNRLGVFIITARSQKLIDQRVQEVYKKVKFKII